MNHDHLLHKLIPMPQAMKNLESKAAIDKECVKFENVSAWRETLVTSEKEEAGTKEDNTFTTLMNLFHLDKSELAEKNERLFFVFNTQKNTTASNVKTILWSHALLTKHMTVHRMATRWSASSGKYMRKMEKKRNGTVCRTRKNWLRAVCGRLAFIFGSQKTCSKALGRMSEAPVKSHNTEDT